MIPVSLKLRNFLSYGTSTEPLDFEQFHVACLSGGNGQGKSALLDAITWALWGEARKASDARKPDEDLLRIGTREMEVELVFDLDETPDDGTPDDVTPDGPAAGRAGAACLRL